MRERLLEYGAEHCHLKRYEETWAEVQPYTDGLVLDVGGESAFTRWMQHMGVQVTCDAVPDVRTCLPWQDGAFDLVVCTEVLEHLRDLETSDRATWEYSGMRSALREMRRVGKRLFLSTPNVTSLRSLDQVLRGWHPFMYPPHVRELAPGDVQQLLIESGWSIERMWTSDCWERGPRVGARRAKQLTAMCNDKTNRGDVIYVHAT